MSGGCAEVDNRVPVYPVSGKILVNGVGAEGAKVVFYGASKDLTGKGTVLPSAVTDSEGNFKLRSYDPEDGAPAGKYAVSIIWPEPIPEGADVEMFEPPDRLKLRYVDPKQSGLTAEVVEGGIDLAPFEL